MSFFLEIGLMIVHYL